MKLSEPTRWMIGSSNDVEHYWFLFRYVTEDGGYECRDAEGNGVPLRTGKAVIYHTRREASAALKEAK